MIFDLGGVIMNIDVDRALNSFAAQSSISGPEINWQSHLPGFFHLFEMGKISEADFRDNLREVLGKNLEDDVLDHCWNQLLLDIPNHRLDHLTTLRKKYKMVLLSNTNSIHTRIIHSRLKLASGAPDFQSYFDRVYYSYQMNLAKPDPRIFEVVLKDNNFQAETTILVDDNGDNIRSAAHMGLQVYQVSQPDAWVDFLT